MKYAIPSLMSLLEFQELFNSEYLTAWRSFFGRAPFELNRKGRSQPADKVPSPGTNFWTLPSTLLPGSKESEKRRAFDTLDLDI